MTTLEDKILGVKKENYCSSSEDEGNDSDISEGEEGKGGGSESCIKSSLGPRAEAGSREGTSSNTGPKGVIRDWERYKELKREKQRERDEERLELIKKLSLTCAPDQEDDAFLLEYQKRRMQEMLTTTTRALPTFGRLIDLANGNDFLEAVDNENQAVTIIVHIYENNVRGCRMMNKSLQSLSKDYPHVKFCKLIGSSAGMSNKFKMDGVPALLVYKAGQVVGSFIRVTDDLGEEFYDGDVENFLIEHGMINDRSCVPALAQTPNQAEDEEDSDLSID